MTRVPRLTSIFCMTTIISELDEDISTVQVEGVLLDASPIVDSPANTKHGRLVVKTMKIKKIKSFAVFMHSTLSFFQVKNNQEMIIGL